MEKAHTEESLQRLNLLRFPLIVGVVFIHAYETTARFSGNAIGIDQQSFLTEFPRNLISQGLARVAVPLFFLISGFLFFYNFTWSTNGYLKKIKSRVYTLLVPFLFWNIATLILVAVAQTLPATSNYFSGRGGIVSNFVWIDYLKSIFGIGQMPISYQFWFIRDLMLLALVTPIIFLSSNVAPKLFIGSLIVNWILNYWPSYNDLSEATLFFSLGCVLALKKIDLFRMDSHGKTIAIVYLVAALTDAASTHMKGDIYIHKLAVILGIVTALYITSEINIKPIKKTLLHLSSASFFVYAAHEPLLTILRKIIYKIIQPNSPYSILALYFTIPVVTITFLLAVYWGMRAHFPNFTKIIAGGRL